MASIGTRYVPGVDILPKRVENIAGSTKRGFLDQILNEILPYIWVLDKGESKSRPQRMQDLLNLMKSDLSTIRHGFIHWKINNSKRLGEEELSGISNLFTNELKHRNFLIEAIEQFVQPDRGLTPPSITIFGKNLLKRKMSDGSMKQWRRAFSSMLPVLDGQILELVRLSRRGHLDLIEGDVMVRFYPLGK